jgi:hypothetical protein
VFAGINLVLGTYAIVFLIGVGHSLADIAVNVVGWLYKPEKPPKPTRAAPVPVPLGARIPDWEHVLHFGGATSQHPAASTVSWQPPALGRVAERAELVPAGAAREDPVTIAVPGDALLQAPARDRPVGDAAGVNGRLKRASRRFWRPPSDDGHGA